MSSSAQHPLDTPIWSALATEHQHLRQGGALACRYRPDVAQFAAVAEDSPAAWQELQRLIEPGGQVTVWTLAPVGELPGLHVARPGVLHQLMAPHGAHWPVESADIVRLGDADAADMLDLTRRTEPGPFKVRTHTMGNYIGLRDGGKLIAMAGERLRIGGYVEISTVCVDDAYRGRGIANRLIRILQNEIGQRGQTPFLHVLDHNSGAFGLYERMGFERRQSFHLTRLQRQEPA
ncbi:GNAT family N-acetyltransferase [uncultured Ralstonia sp.]|jgi:predicted GNAT family acetyltransferase|uniref:GNAT family N-acetyltransferase n=1 Tax=Ralstonia sp. TaxID=54061 RepID=UPI001EA66C92|nr:GNAT family N-acetyltransferase [uncultured Ralstonia sp.]UCF22850.1 MAG: GNAT family N-acetyltransferase [Ralstonia sp.]